MSRRGSAKLIIVIAAAAVLVGGAAAVWLLWPGDPRPSGKFNVERITISGDPWKLADKPAGEGDGAADIAAAIKSFDDAQTLVEKDLTRSSNDNLYDRVVKAYVNPVDVTTQLPWRSAEFLQASSAKGQFSLEQNVTMPPLEYNWPKMFCKKLDAIALAALTEGKLAEKRNHPDQAEKIYQAVLIYGVRLADNPVRVYYQAEGLSAQAEAADALARLYKSQNKADKARLAEEYMTAAQSTLSKARDETFMPVCRHANKWDVGDLLLFANKHPDPAWRVEALLALGMCRHNPVGEGREKAIARCLNKAASDSDANVSAAAKWARDLTMPDYRAQSGQGSN